MISGQYGEMLAPAGNCNERKAYSTYILRELVGPKKQQP